MERHISQIETYIKKNNNIYSMITDHTEYKCIKLNNKLTVFIIKDTTEFETALLYVGAGNNNNPENALGIAHFLEHMLFMGSDMFAGGTFFQSEVKTNGGYTNAFTTDTSTQYYFTATNNFLYLLKIFSRFFIKPLFDSKYVEKEVNAVNSEHNKNISSDGWRCMHIIKTFIENHPYCAFGTGTKETLLPDNNVNSLREKLIQFYKTYYSADKMILYVSCSNDYINEISEMFNEIPNNNNNIILPNPIIKYYDDSFELIKINTVNKDNYMAIFWLLDGSYKVLNNRTSYNILEYILNNTNNMLKKINICISSYATINKYYNNSVLFEINIKLTDITKWKYILYYVCAYMQYLINIDIFYKFYDEYKQYVLLHAQATDKISGNDLCHYYASIYETTNLDHMYIPINNLLFGNIDECKKCYTSYLNNMTIYKVKVLIYSPHINNKYNNKTDKYYNTTYFHKIKKINNTLFNKFAHINFPKPIKNKFIINYDIKPIRTCNSNNTDYVRVASPHNIYYINSNNTFNTTSIFAKITIKLDSMLSLTNDKHDVWIHILMLCLYVEKIKETQIQMMQNARINIIIIPEQNNILIIIDGYNTPFCIYNIFKTCLEWYYNISSIDVHIYEQVYDNLLNTLLNYDYKNIHELIIPEFCKKFNNKHISSEKLLDALHKYKHTDYKQFMLNAIKYMSKGSIMGVFSGSITINQITSIISTLEKYIANMDIHELQYNKDNNHPHKYVITSMNNNNTEYAIGIGIHINLPLIEHGEEWGYTKCYLKILNAIVSEHFAESIRTEKQIGYIAHTQLVNIADVCNPDQYIMFVVQSTNNNLYDIVMDYIENEMMNHLHNITISTFDILKESMISELKEKTHNVQTECSYIFSILQTTYNIFKLYKTTDNFDLYMSNRFNKKTYMIDILKMLTLNDFLKFATYIHKNKRDVLEIVPLNSK